MPTYRTKGELRASLLIKLGYGGLGAAAGNFVPMADELLEEAQDNIYLVLPDDKKTREWTFTTGLSQQWYDFPSTCDPERIRCISTYFNDVWFPLKRGIEIEHDSNLDRIYDHPYRYDIRYNDAVSKEQLQLWPTDDATQYTVKIEGMFKLANFVADGDRASLDDRLILMYAEAYGKAHLNRPDAQLKMQALIKRMSLLRGQQHGQKRYVRGEKTEEPIPKPRVV